MGMLSWLSGSTSPRTTTAGVDSTVDPKRAPAFSGDLETVPRALSTCYYVEGFLACDYFRQALSLSSKVAQSSKSVQVETSVWSESEFFGSRLPELKKIVPASGGHRSCPIVYEGCDPDAHRYVGGYDDFAKLAASRHGVKQ
ncbi:hypothetical protein BC828DRAFT_391460 [Blastocladiella britannica]|nr:hypothetical protein BC828DRAFT_391460 [Blastocladiella britannica]